MKKLLLYGCLFAICVGAGCKKGNKTLKTYLLKQQITDNTGAGGSIDTANYAYDDQDRPVNVSDFSGQGKVTFTLTYDSQNRVSTAKKTGSNGNLIIEYDFFYQGDAAGYYLYGSTHVADTANFVFNEKHQVIDITTKHSGHTTFAYDTRGNVASTQIYATDGLNQLTNEDDYAYDTKKNPFSQMTPASNLFIQYILFINNPSTLINNVASKNGEPYLYTYNTDGYPLSVVITLYNHNLVKEYYSYIVK
jgi:hypothetical protein